MTGAVGETSGLPLTAVRDAACASRRRWLAGEAGLLATRLRRALVADPAARRSSSSPCLLAARRRARASRNVFVNWSDEVPVVVLKRWWIGTIAPWLPPRARRLSSAPRSSLWWQRRTWANRRDGLSVTARSVPVRLEHESRISRFVDHASRPSLLLHRVSKERCSRVLELARQRRTEHRARAPLELLPSGDRGGLAARTPRSGWQSSCGSTASP